MTDSNASQKKTKHGQVEVKDLKLKKDPSGGGRYSNITLKKGYIHNTQLEDWWNNT